VPNGSRLLARFHPSAFCPSSLKPHPSRLLGHFLPSDSFGVRHWLTRFFGRVTQTAEPALFAGDRFSTGRRRKEFFLLFDAPGAP
jgi:hypothetical protein